MRITWIGSLLLVLGACSSPGPTGPVGTMGPQGEQGPPEERGSNGLPSDPCLHPSEPGCSAAAAALSCKALKKTPSFVGGDGTYWIDPDGAGGKDPFEAWCDMTTEGGGWTRVFSVLAPATDCVMGTGYTADPRVRSECAKLSDAVINQLATERIFYTQVEWMPKLFTRYTGVLSSQGNAVTTIGQVVTQESYTAVQAATPSYTPKYSGFILFSQHDWYEPDTQLGSRASSCRFSLEHLSTSGQRKDACCSPDCSIFNHGWMTAYVK
ncbi:fibrinogen-like YCDxxxxGGGW domain-containing protein [Hyalangium sp.]|uniref:fibrinogen-like YCDxxxxGGGW domain-containing protein n=1 Tax=Hyalangium sp. TaxID=2028555 RepID=UPI002D4ED21A|nr:fibrinogen-like YCDxxxxGGGW domain-containing protein [Hyalangium sp.]HYH98855.1 fibrinogen-like YCDxxxxGGGW domain-containing protein [Hyalangium sp.]